MKNYLLVLFEWGHDSKVINQLCINTSTFVQILFEIYKMGSKEKYVLPLFHGYDLVLGKHH